MQRLFKNISLIWNKFKKSNEDFWLEVEEQLILNDIGAQTAAFIIEEVKNHCRKENINDLEQIKMLLKKYVRGILKDEGRAPSASASAATVVAAEVLATAVKTSVPNTIVGTATVIAPKVSAAGSVSSSAGYTVKTSVTDTTGSTEVEAIVSVAEAGTTAAVSAVSSDGNLSGFIPSVWMLVGVNGVGKTSTVAKLAAFFQKEGKNVLLGAADTFRAAAYEQLDHFAEKLNLPIVHHQRGSDPGAVVFDSIDKAVARKIDIVLIDTAGRMHTAYNLMEELKKIKKIINKKTGRDPDEILMVIDATTGQNAKHQAAIFNEAVGLTGIILTKTDGTSKGGIVLTVKNELKIPVKFMTFGEKIEDLEVFDADKFTDLLFS